MNRMPCFTSVDGRSMETGSGILGIVTQQESCLIESQAHFEDYTIVDLASDIGEFVSSAYTDLWYYASQLCREARTFELLLYALLLERV